MGSNKEAHGTNGKRKYLVTCAYLFERDGG